MLKFAPLLLALAYGLALYQFSAWRLRRELDARSSLLSDPQLAPVFARLALALGVPRLKVHLYEIAPVNGLAAPDGRIFLTRGFYERFRAGAITAEELASVVAHELGHVALGHSRRRMIDFTGQNALRMVLGPLLGRVLPGLGGLLAGLVSGLLSARLSRNDEYEADAYAAALMTRAGLGTAPQKALFRKLDHLTGTGTGTGGNAGAGGRSGAAWLASHPASPERIAAIEALERKWQA